MAGKEGWPGMVKNHVLFRAPSRSGPSFLRKIFDTMLSTQFCYRWGGGGGGGGGGGWGGMFTNGSMVTYTRVLGDYRG